jgi:predicted metalloprotease
MRWQGRRESGNVEDRRGFTPRGGGAMGLGGIILVGAIALLMGADPRELLTLLGGLETGAPSADQPAPQGPPTDEQGRFAAVVLADTEETWQGIFQGMGASYQEPKLVLFTSAVESACGFASSAVGPFYCPRDGNVYVDLVFFEELAQRFGAPGDFAQAYVIAHEVGHHVQKLLGIDEKVRAMQARASEGEANALSVRMELQADCFAGVWGHAANRERQLLDPGDVEEGLAAAAAIGDDTLQRRSSGQVQPESWTHGSSEQRASWLRKGLSSGDAEACDTFSGSAR